MSDVFLYFFPPISIYQALHNIFSAYMNDALVFFNESISKFSTDSNCQSHVQKLLALDKINILHFSCKLNATKTI